MSGPTEDVKVGLMRFWIGRKLMLSIGEGSKEKEYKVIHAIWLDDTHVVQVTLRCVNAQEGPVIELNIPSTVSYAL